VIGLAWSKWPAKDLHNSTLMVAQCRESARHKQNDESEAAAQDYGKKNSEYRSSGLGFMRTRQADTIHHQSPHPRDESAADGNHLQNAG